MKMNSKLNILIQHYYDDDEEDGWEMPNFYNDTYNLKEGSVLFSNQTS